MKSNSRKDNWFESALTWLWPDLLVNGTQWERQWREQQRSSFVTLIRIASPTIALIYIAHYFFYDVPMQLEPIDDWFALRMSVATTWLACFLYYLTPLHRARFYKVPAIIGCAAMCYSQALATLWYGQWTWIFGFILIISSVMLLRSSVLKSLVFTLAMVALQSTIYVQTDLSAPDILTGTLVAIGTAIALRSSYTAEIKYFLLSQENIEAERRISELNSDLAKRIQAFIPRVIADRINETIANERRTVVEATINVLEPQHKPVACLFSDIREFTKHSNDDIDGFVSKSVIPEVKACSDAIEAFGGVPRKIGDLVFAYFDSEDQSKNILSAVLASFNISRLNQDMNETYLAVNINRYILVSAGNAIVGNVGGLDSSIEITALGPPVNFLSRLDDATKAPNLAKQLKSGDLIVSEECFTTIPELRLLDHDKIDLNEIGVKIRDFPEERNVFRIPATDVNMRAIRENVQNLNTYDDPRPRTVGET